jgi:hypothetical protein
VHFVLFMIAHAGERPTMLFIQYGIHDARVDPDHSPAVLDNIHHILKLF